MEENERDTIKIVYSDGNDAKAVIGELIEETSDFYKIKNKQGSVMTIYKRFTIIAKPWVAENKSWRT
jgi:uncharacterized protein YxjI